MKNYVARRLLALIPVGLVVATVAFLLIHLAPGNPASLIARSIFLRKPVTEAILDREPTLLLTVFSTVIAVLIGVPAGVLSARYHNSIADQALMLLALLGISITNFL